MAKLFKAGVRQGCPLSPLLYVCVAEALLRFLKHTGVGVTVLGVNLTSTQFADDTQVLLPSEGEVPAFLQVMNVFAAASGQHLNRRKTKLFLLGLAARRRFEQQQQQQQQAAPLHGLQTVLSATVLGVCIGGDGVQAWDKNVEGVMRALSRLSCIKQLSIFGRGLGSAAYGISKLLYCAEFSDPPTPQQCRHLAAAVAKVVDGGLAPDSPGRRFAGVSATLLQGKAGA